VSENDNGHCAGTTKVEVTSHGKERLKRKAFKRPWKTDIEGADVMCWGRLFQVWAVAAGKARLPTMPKVVYCSGCCDKRTTIHAWFDSIIQQPSVWQALFECKMCVHRGVQYKGLSSLPSTCMWEQSTLWAVVRDLTAPQTCPYTLL